MSLDGAAVSGSRITLSLNEIVFQLYFRSWKITLSTRNGNFYELLFSSVFLYSLYNTIQYDQFSLVQFFYSLKPRLSEVVGLLELVEF